MIAGTGSYRASGGAGVPEPVIRVVDLETTGLDAAPERGGHMPIEVACVDLVAGSDLLGETDWTAASVGPPLSELCLPGREIPPESSAVHHLLACDLVGADRWQPVITRIVGRVTRPVAFAAHNAWFEQQWCTPERVGPEPWLCTWKCALRAWPEAPGHGNQVLRYWLRPAGLDRALATPAHRAGPDAYVTAFLLRELLRAHPLERLLQWSAEPALLVRVPFGRRPEEGGSRGRKWSEVDTSLLRWVLDREFSAEVLHTARVELERRSAADTGDDGDADAI